MNRETARARAKELVAQMTLEEKASQLRFEDAAKIRDKLLRIRSEIENEQ